MQTEIILKVQDPCLREKRVINKIVGELDPANFCKLVDIADLKANPRDCKTGNVTDAIYESLERDPQLFEHKTKGILLACSECQKLERNRFRLHFDDEDIEGILDGGHNVLGIARFVLSCAIDEPDKVLRKVKVWDDLKQYWVEHREQIEEIIDDLDFFVPIEISYARPDDEGVSNFVGSILEIAQARNNNVQLAIETKSNKAGHYDYLKQALDPNLAEQVEWRTNSGGRLKVREVVALSTIALSRIKADIPAVQRINPVSIYRNKGFCVENFDRIMNTDGVCKDAKGDIKELVHPEVQSALDIMHDLPHIYDWIYINFPDYYNGVSPRFGAISSVRYYDEKVQNFDKRKHLKKPALSRYYQTECKYDYPDGFIMPLVWSASELMESRKGSIKWKCDPIKYYEKNLDEIMKVYYSFIQMAAYDPQGVGKVAGAYDLVATLVRTSL